MAPASLNIVCFRHRGEDPDALNAELIMRLHEAGRVASSSPWVRGKLAIRAAIVNHRTDERDIAALVKATLELGRALRFG